MMARPKRFEPLTPKFVVWSNERRPLKNFANRTVAEMQDINHLAAICKPSQVAAK